MDLSRAKYYIALLGLMLIIAAIISVYTFIENYLNNRKAKRKRKVIFRTKGGKTKGYWKTKSGEDYDKDLTLED